MIELSEMINELRAELDEARKGATDDGLRFELGPIDLEVTVAVEKKGGAGAKVRFYVIELGADAQAATNTTQKIKMVLRPTLPSFPGVSAKQQRQDAYVKGAEVESER